MRVHFAVVSFMAHTSRPPPTVLDRRVLSVPPLHSECRYSGCSRQSHPPSKASAGASTSNIVEGHQVGWCTWLLLGVGSRCFFLPIWEDAPPWPPYHCPHSSEWYCMEARPSFYADGTKTTAPEAQNFKISNPEVGKAVWQNEHKTAVAKIVQ